MSGCCFVSDGPQNYTGFAAMFSAWTQESIISENLELCEPQRAGPETRGRATKEQHFSRSTSLKKSTPLSTVFAEVLQLRNLCLVEYIAKVRNCWRQTFALQTHLGPFLLQFAENTHWRQAGYEEKWKSPDVYRAISISTHYDVKLLTLRLHNLEQGTPACPWNRIRYEIMIFVYWHRGTGTWHLLLLYDWHY